MTNKKRDSADHAPIAGADTPWEPTKRRCTDSQADTTAMEDDTAHYFKDAPDVMPGATERPFVKRVFSETQTRTIPVRMLTPAAPVQHVPVLVNPTQPSTSPKAPALKAAITTEGDTVSFAIQVVPSHQQSQNDNVPGPATQGANQREIDNVAQQRTHEMNLGTNMGFDAPAEPVPATATLTAQKGQANQPSYAALQQAALFASTPLTFPLVESAVPMKLGSSSYAPPGRALFSPRKFTVRRPSQSSLAPDRSTVLGSLVTPAFRQPVSGSNLTPTAPVRHRAFALPMVPGVEALIPAPTATVFADTTPAAVFPFQLPLGVNKGLSTGITPASLLSDLSKLPGELPQAREAVTEAGRAAVAVAEQLLAVLGDEDEPEAETVPVPIPRTLNLGDLFCSADDVQAVGNAHEKGTAALAITTGQQEEDAVPDSQQLITSQGTQPSSSEEDALLGLKQAVARLKEAQDKAAETKKSAVLQQEGRRILEVLQSRMAAVMEEDKAVMDAAGYTTGTVKHRLAEAYGVCKELQDSFNTCLSRELDDYKNKYEELLAWQQSHQSDMSLFQQSAASRAAAFQQSAMQYIADAEAQCEEIERQAATSPRNVMHKLQEVLLSTETPSSQD